MTRTPDDLRRLAQELAELAPEERAWVFRESARRVRFRSPPADFTPHS